MKAVGVILAGGNSGRMGKLAAKRAASAMPVAGGYRAIDFALSNMAASGIGSVAVLAQYNSGSLNRHLSSSKWWDFGRKEGGLIVINPTITTENENWYRGTADALYQNLNFLKSSHEPYAVIAGGDCIYTLDYSKVLDFHTECGADITVVCTEFPEGDDPSRFGFVETDGNGRIVEIEQKPQKTEKKLVSCGIYILRRRHLIELLERCRAEGGTDFVRDILIRHGKERRICAYRMDGYFANIADVNAYFRANMDFLRPEVRNYFSESGTVRTKVEDLPPAKYNTVCGVKNSLVADGCVINGRVENSLLFKDVYIGNHCTIRNSIVLNNVYIGDNTVLENCIVESRDVLGANSRYIGTPDSIEIVVVKNDRF